MSIKNLNGFLRRRRKKTGSHFRRSRRDACAPAARREIFDEVEIPGKWITICTRKSVCFSFLEDYPGNSARFLFLYRFSRIFVYDKI